MRRTLGILSVVVLLGYSGTGCTSDGVVHAVPGERCSVELPKFPEGMPPIAVRTGKFTVSSAVVIPPEMKEIEPSHLTELASKGIEQVLSGCPDVDVQPATAGNQTEDGRPVLELVGEISRLELTGSLQDDLEGKFLMSNNPVNNAANGSSVRVSRTLALDINYRLLRPNGTPAAAGTGEAKAKIPISATVATQTQAEGATAKTTRSLKDGKADRGSLAPAFQTASCVGAASILKNVISRARPATPAAAATGTK